MRRPCSASFVVHVVPVVFALAAAGCEFVTPTNPFDTETPPEEQAKAKLVGSVVLVDAFSSETRAATLAAVTVGLLDESGRPLANDDGTAVAHSLVDVEGDAVDDGAFAGQAVGRGGFVFDGLVPGRYTVSVRSGVPSYYTQAPTVSVLLLPGVTIDVGDVVFTAMGGDTGPGTIRGEITLDGGAGGQRSVSLYERHDGQTVQVRSVTTDGAFELRGLNPGAYALVAESDGYAPSYRLAITVDDTHLDQNFAGESAVVLRPVSGVVLPVPGADVRLDDGSYYVRGDAIDVALLEGTSAADVGVTALRIGTNAALLDPTGQPLPFEDFTARKTVAFPHALDGDGARLDALVEGPVTIYAQLKAEGAGGFLFTSPVFATTVIRDVTAPRVIEPALLGVAEDAAGTWLASSRALVVRFDAQDTTSGVDRIGVALGDAPPATLDDVTSPPGLVRIERSLNAATDGATSAFLVVEDKAGNRAEPIALPVVVDTTPPDVRMRVDNAVAGVLSSRVARVAFDTTGAQNDLPVAMQLRVVGDSFGPIEPWTPEGAVVVVEPALGEDGDPITIEARLFDRVGNELTVDDDVTLRLRGTIAGTVAVDDRLLTPSPAGAVVVVKTLGGALVREQTVDAGGGFAIAEIPEGRGYAVEVSLDGLRPARRAGITMPAPDAESIPAVVDVERIELATARGSVVGTARLADVDGNAGHGGITLTLSLTGPFGRSFVDGAETDDAGEFTFTGVPATRPGESIVVQARHDEYATAATRGSVVADVVNVLDDVLLARNTSDFVVCRPTGPCVSERYVNTDVVRIQLVDPTDVTTLFVSVAGGAPQEIAIDPDNATPVSIAGHADGTLALVVQTQQTGGDRSAPLAGSIVLDTAPPQAPTLTRIADAAARDPRFTRQPFVDVVLHGEAGEGAPLSLPRLVVADAAPADVAELLGCEQGTPCRVDLPGRAGAVVAEKLHTVWGVSCDLAGNCAAPVSTFVVHDHTAPRVSSGAAFRVVATGSIVDASGAIPVTVLPTASYAGEMSLGRARTEAGDVVVDELGVPVADVFAFRFSLARATLPRATLQAFSDPPVADATRSGADVVVPALAPTTGAQTIFSELVDAAGNVGDGFDAAVRVDDEPPSLLLTVNSGAATRDPSVPWSIAVPAGGEAPVRVELRVDGGAATSFALPLTGDERVTLAGGDGAHRVQATGFDAVGNAATSEVAIVLDREGPRVDAFRCSSTTCTDDGLGAILSNAANAQLDLAVVAADALSPVTAVQVKIGNGPPATFAIDAVRGVQLLPDTQGTIAVAAVDAVGNVGAPLVRAFVHDATAPAVTALSLDGGAAVTQALQIPVHVQTSDDVVAFRFASTRAFAGAFAPFRNDDFVTLASGDGNKQVCVQVKDAAGNTGDACASILLDRGPPQGTLTVVGPSTTSSLLVPVQLAFSADTTRVAVSATALACESTTTPYVATTTSPMSASVQLPPGDGVRTLFACFADGAGNVAAATAAVTIDRTAPVVAATLGGGAAFATSTAVELALVASDDAAKMAVVVDGALDCATATYGAFAARTTVTLPASDGAHTARVCVEDGVGNRTATPTLASVVLDLTNPTGTLLIDGGNAFTTTLTPSVLVSGQSSDVVRMAAAPVSGLDCATASYVAFSPGVAVRLPGPDGVQVVSVCLQDAAGRTARIEDTIVLDRAAPRGTIVAAGGAATTALRDVDVTLTFDADTDGIFVSAFPIACAGAVFSAPATTTSVSLPFVGANTVTACLRDGAGNISSITDDIFLENTAGDALVIAIDGGAAAARTRNVVVNLFRPSTDFTEMKLVEGPTLDCSDLSGYEAFNTSKALTLSSGTSPAEGTRTVTACVRSPTATTTKSASDTIFLDTFAPAGSVTLDVGAAITRNATVTASLTNTFAAAGEVVTVALSETSTLVGGECSGSFEAFAAAKPFTFSGLDGVRTMFVCLRDVAGNTREVSDTITLDRAAPSPVFVSVPATSTSTSVTASLNFPADAVEVATSAGALDCATTQTYVPAASTRTVTLAAVEGVQNVFACFKDAAGNVSQATASTTVDLVDPAGAVVVNDGAAFATTRNVTLALSASADVARMSLVESASTPDCAAATYQAFSTRPSFQLSVGDGEKTVQACLEDRAGRRAAAVPDTIVVDTTAPNGTLVIADGAAATRERTVTLTLATGGNADVVAAAVAEGSITCNASNLAYVPFSPVTAFVLSSGDGEKTVRSCLKDAAGNVSRSSGVGTITLDTAAPALPTAPVDVTDGDGFLQAESTVNVTLRWSTAGDAAFGKVAEGSIDCQSAAGYVALSSSSTSQTFASVPVSSGDGLKLFAACFKDAAGNVATGQDTTLRDGTAPTVTSLVCTDCTNNGTTTFTTDNTVALAVGSDESGAGVASALVAIDGGLDAAAAVTGGVVTVGNLAAGAHAIAVKLVDRAGNASSSTQAKSLSLTFDNTPPSLTALTLSGGATATNTRNVTVAVTGASSDVVAMAVAEADGSSSAIASCASATYAPFVATFVRTLPANDGNKAVSVCLKDAAGNTSTTPTTTTIALDTLPPSLPAGAVDIQDGDGFLQGETTVNVVLRWNVSGDARFAKVGEGIVDCAGQSGYVALPGAATTTTVNAVPVSSGDGPRTIAACFADAAGNTTTAQDITVRDATAPTVTSLVCTDCTSDGTTTFSTDGAISIAVTSDEAGTGVASALVSVDGGADAAATVTNGVVAVGSLAAGARTVRVKLVDRAGNTSSTAQARTLALTVDTTPPALSSSADFRLNGANSGRATNDPAVTVTIAGPPVDAVQMAIAEAASLSCATATYLPIATTSTFVVSTGSQGLKTLQLCLKDRAGNTTTVAHTASITFDDVAPSLPAAAVIIQDGGDELLSSVTGGVSVRLNWNVVGDVVAFKLGENTVDCSSEPYERPTGIASVNTTLKTGFALSSVDGVKLIAACFKDAAGNVVSAQDSTVLDQVGPNGSVLVNGGASFATDASESVTLTLRASSDVVRFVATETTNAACTTATVNCASATGFASIGGALVDGIITTTVAANLSGVAAASEGAKCFEVCFEDAAGNRSATAALDGIEFDKSAPSLLSSGIVVVGLDKSGASQTRTRTPFVTVTLSGQPSDTAEMRVSEDGTFLAGTQPFVPFSTSAQQLTLSAGDATKTIFVQLKDRAGNIGSAAQKAIILDTTPPSGTALVLAAGATVTRNATVTAALQATSATEMKILTPDNGSDAESFVAFSSSASVTIEDTAGDDGPKTVLVIFRDDAGNESAAASDGIDLDRAAPTADSLTCGATTSTGVCINAGASATNSVSASLALAATGATEVQIAVDGCADTESFVPFSTATSVLLSSGDATKTVAVRFRDAAGNVDQAFVNCGTTPGRTDTIVLDTVAPSPALSVTLTSAQAGDSAGFTSTGQVRVSLGFSPGTGEETSVKHGEGSVDCGTAAGYVALPGTSPLVLGDNNPTGDTPIALSSGDGTKTYVACFKDDAGNVTSTTGTIAVDSARPTGTLVLNGGAAITNSTSVTATLTFSADTNGVAFVRDATPTCNASLTYVTPSSTMATTLSSTDGSKQLFACFRDGAGNFSATPAAATITLDTQAPTVTIDARRAGTAAPGDAGSTRFTNTREVIVSVSALASDATSIALQNGTPTAPCSTAVFVPVPQTAPFNLAFTLDDSDTLQTVGVCARDAAGNVGTKTKQIKLDRTGPQVTLSINSGATITNASAATVSLTASPSNDSLRRVTTTDASVDCAFTTFSGTFATQPTSFSLTLPTGDGDKTAVACLQDEAGNVARAQDTIALDQTAPVGSFSLASGAAFATSTTVTLNFSGVSSDVTSMKTAESGTIDCSVATGYTAFVNGTSTTLSSTDGTKTMQACLKDAAGNTVQLSDSIVLDRVDPAVTFSLERRSGPAPDATFTNSREVVLRVTTLSSDTVAIATAETSIDCGTASYRTLPQPLPSALSDDLTLASGSDGTRTVAVCVKDAAGRTNGTLGTSSSITLDTTPPSVTLSINAGASLTKSDAVTVTQTSGIVGDLLRASSFHTDANVNCAQTSFSGTFATVRPTVSATLANVTGFDDSGTKIVVGCYQDRAGNTASASDDIFFDEDRPNFGGRPLCTGCELVDAIPDRTFTLGDPFLGFTKSTSTVDFDVPVASADVDFVLAMATTDDVQSNGGALGEDRACTVNGDCAGSGETCADFPVNDLASPNPPTTAKRCVIATAFPDTVAAPVRSLDGKFSVIVALVDAAGNFSNTREVFVVRDTVAPGVTFSLNATTATRDQTVFVQSLQMRNETFFSTTTQIGTFQASTLATFADALALPFTATSAPFTLSDPIPVALTAGDGAKTVRVRVVDNAGNVGTVGTASITLDTTAPSRPIFATGSSVVGPLSSPLSVSLAAQSTDALSGLRATRPYDVGLPPGVSCELVDGAATELQAFGTSCRWTGNAFNLSVSALGADGEKRIFVNAVDVAGNFSDSDVLTLQVDSVAPTKPCYRSGCVAPTTEFTSDSTTTQNVNSPTRDEHFSTYQACVAATSACSCSDPLDVPGVPFTVTLNENQTNFVCVRAKDQAGNVSAFDFAQIEQDNVAPAVPQFDEPLTEVTGDQTTLLFSSANTSHLDKNFSHYEVIGGGHVNAKKMCMDVSSPFCTARAVDRFFFVDGASPTKPAAMIVDLEPETENVFQIEAVDKAGNHSSSAVVTVDEGSLIIAKALSETTSSDAMSAFGDRVVYIEDDGAFDDTDKAVLVGPGKDLRYGTSDDENVTLSTTVLVAADTSTATFDTPAKQKFAVSGSPFGVVWVDEGASPATQSGVIKLRRPTDTLFDSNDTTITLTPFSSGCGAQKGFRNPSMSQDKFVVSCMFSDTDHDVYLARPGTNGVYEATGTVGRDDVFFAVATSSLREHLPALSHETAIWVQEDSANSFSILTLRPGPDGILNGTGDVRTTLVSGLTAAQVMAPAAYMPDDPSVPSCAQGVAYVTPDNPNTVAANDPALLFHSPGVDGLFNTADDTKTTIETQLASNLSNGLAKVQLGSGVIAYKTGFLDGETIVSPGKDRCFANKGVASDDVRIDNLSTFGSADIAAGQNGWVEFSTPGIFQNQILFHDLITRRALVDGVTTNVTNVAMGSGFAAFTQSSGQAKLFDFTFIRDEGVLLRSTNQSAVFERSIRSGGGKLGSSEEDADALFVIEPDSDGNLFTTGATSVRIASDATGGQVIDDIAVSQRNFGLSSTVFSFFTGVDPGGGAGSFNVRLQFAGANGKFELDGGGGGEDDCQVNITASAASRSYLTVDGVRVAWVDRDGTGNNSGSLQVFEPTSTANPCGGGTTTTLTDAVFTRVRNPVLAGNRLVAFEADASGVATNLVLFETGSDFKSRVNKRRSCRVPTGWDVRGGSDTLTMFEGSAIFIINPIGGNLAKMLACDLTNDTVRMLDPNQPGGDRVSAFGRTLVVESFADDSVFQYQLDR